MPDRVRVAWGGGPDSGDFAVGGAPADLDRLRDGLLAHPWTWLRQVHGARVVVVDEPGAHAGDDADAAVTAVPGAALAVHTADCAPVRLFDGEAGVVGVAHAGWRGVVAGVLEATVDAMHDLGATTITASVGPHIRARCYEFGVDDLAVVADRYGDDVRATTGWGTPALDVTAAVHAALTARDVAVHDDGGCTACEPRRYFSHRARGDAGRHATAIALVP